MAVNTLDDLSREQYAQAERAINAFRASSKDNTAQHNLRDALCDAGLTDESADEYTNLFRDEQEL